MAPDMTQQLPVPVELTTDYTCPECDGGIAKNWKGDPVTCDECGGTGLLPAFDLDEIITRIKGRKPRTLRSKAPEHWGRECNQHDKRAYYVWRMAKFNGGQDMTMPMTAMSVMRHDRAMMHHLDEIADAVARACFKTDMAAAYRWGRALGLTNAQPPNDMPVTAYEGGPDSIGNPSY